jgi:hypothetical protein
MQLPSNLLVRLLGLGTIAFISVAMVSPAVWAQDVGWQPSRPGADAQRLRDQVASRRPGMQSAESPKTSDATASRGASAVAPASHLQPPMELIFEESHSARTMSDMVTLDDGMSEMVMLDDGMSDHGEVFHSGHPLCDCPQCVSGVTAAGQPLHDLLSQLNGCGWWITTDYLLWSLDGMDLPTLVTTSPSGTSPAATGVLGLGSTSDLFGGTVGEDFRSGGRITVGMWLDPARQWSWEASYMGFSRDAQRPTFSSAATPHLARPVFDTLTASETAVLIAHPTFLTGTTAIDASTELQAFEIVRRQPWLNDGVFNFDLLLGYKHGDLDEFLRIDDSSTYALPRGPVLAGTAISRFDQFDIENRFDGFLMGLDRRHIWQGWMIGYTGKLSVGANRARVRIDGRTTTTVPGNGTSVATGGLLAQSSNIGEFQRSQFAVLPEFEFLVRRQVTERVRLHAGYSLLYWSATTRVGDTLSRRVSQFPPEPVSGTREPRFVWTDGGFFAHGFQFGLDYKF